MPHLVIHTNVARGDVPKELLLEASKTVAEMIGKPEKFVQIHVNPDQVMTFGGTFEPTAACRLESIGGIDTEKNKNYTTQLMDSIEKHLKIPTNRIYINYVDFARENVGWDGKTFAR